MGVNTLIRLVAKKKKKEIKVASYVSKRQHSAPVKAARASRHVALHCPHSC